MSFSAAWLDRREPYDRAATARQVLAAVGAALAGRSPIRAVDLGAGTGAAIRTIAPELPVPQHWLAIEREAELVAAGRGRLAGALPPGVEVEWRQLDLAAPGGLARAVPAEVDLVSAAALFDLVSRSWLRTLVDLLVARHAVLWSRLTVDGRIAFAPPDPFDARVVALFHSHQRTDKGFGAALGPAAARVLRQLLASHLGRIIVAASDWRLGPGDGALQRELIAGLAQAAAAMAPAEAVAIAGWQKRRLAHLAEGRSTLCVGHCDLAWLPPSVTCGDRMLPP